MSQNRKERFRDKTCEAETTWLCCFYLIIKRSSNCCVAAEKQTLGSAHDCEEIRVQSEREFPQMISTVYFNELTGSPALIRVAEIKQTFSRAKTTQAGNQTPLCGRMASGSSEALKHDSGGSTPKQRRNALFHASDWLNTAT